MNTSKILSTLAILLIAGFASMAFINKKPAGKTPVTSKFDGKGFAVVELFTSEGCSSCPAADAVVAKIEKESAGKAVYILAYHVDYWNRLGWKDVFSSADYSRRQNTYAKWLNLSSVYTPQVVVNGQKEFVGSQEGTLRNAITAGIIKAPKGELTLNGLNATNGDATVKYTVEGAGKNTALIFALIEKNATTAVKAGENDGRTLLHVQIVTKIETVTLNGSKSGEASINLPKNFAAQNFEVIAFVQNTKNGEILAASRAAFSTLSASN
nr:DUF1223 domain-containing protein [uncultured Mucilaginibacter sp.]